MEVSPVDLRACKVLFRFVAGDVEFDAEQIRIFTSLAW